jgi:hypothetical protein
MAGPQIRESVTVAGRAERAARSFAVGVLGPGHPCGDDVSLAVPCWPGAEGGLGLQLVADLAARWEWRRRGGRAVTWFELRHPAAGGEGEV